MQHNEMEQLLRVTMRRTDILRAVLVGLLAGICIVVSAYVSLAAGLWAAVGAFILLMAFWSFTHQRRQKPIADRVTAPALAQAFEKTVYTLPGRLPQAEQRLLFPDSYTARCSDLVAAVWQGMSFTFANVVMREQRKARPVFHGQWLVIRTDWDMHGRVLVRGLDGDKPIAADMDSVLPAVDSDFRRMYKVETDVPNMAAIILSGALLRSLLMAHEGTRLLVENGVVHLAIPSDQPFFQLTGLEENITQVQNETQQQISAIQAWLDGILAVEMPERAETPV